MTDPATAIQLGVSPSRMLVRGFLHRCPVCGGGGVIRRWFSINERCPTCDLLIERVEGHVIGYIGLNTIVCFTLTFLTLFIGAVVMAPDIQPQTLVLLALIPAGLGPILFFPSSRMVWTAIDLIMRPLKPGEVDPRFVLNDPGRDHPTGG
jgi:uncharacterized protein (DUF983 family)